MGQTGIAIYLKDSLEALYTGTDLSLDQIKNMTDGDGSEAAIANSVHQYGLDWLWEPLLAEIFHVNEV